MGLHLLAAAHSVAWQIRGLNRLQKSTSSKADSEKLLTFFLLQPLPQIQQVQLWVPGESAGEHCTSWKRVTGDTQVDASSWDTDTPVLWTGTQTLALSNICSAFLPAMYQTLVSQLGTDQVEITSCKKQFYTPIFNRISLF